MGGIVQFSYLLRPHGVRTVVNVWPKVEKVEALKAKKVVVKKEAKNEAAPKVKKVAVKKPVVKRVVAKK